MSKYLELLKLHISQRIPMYVSSDSKHIHFGESKVPSNEVVQLPGFGRKKQPLDLTVGQIWFFLKSKVDSVHGMNKKEEFPPISVRDRVAVNHYFGISKTMKMDSELFEKPKFTKPKQPKRKRSENGVESSQNVVFQKGEPEKKKRKLGENERVAKDNFFEAIDKLSENEIEDKKFKSFLEIEDLDVSFDRDEYSAYLDLKEADEDNRNIQKFTVDVTNSNLLLRGSSYENVIDCSFIRDIYSKIRVEEKFVEKFNKKYNIKKEKPRKRKNNTAKEMEDFGIDPMDYGNKKKEELKMGEKQISKPFRKKKKKKVKTRKIVKNPHYDLGLQEVKKRIEPIIIVPGQISSLLTIYNSKSFLENSFFKTTERCKQENQRRDKYVKISHTNKSNKTTTYRIYDNVKYLKNSDWRNVCAIFTNGKSYEFKNYPAEFFGKGVTQLFSRIKGFHLCYDEAPIEENIKKWPIMIMKVSKSKEERHKDITATTQFWNTIQ